MHGCGPIDTAGATRVIDRRLSRRDPERPLGTHLSSMRVPARFFCYLGGPAAYTAGSFFKRVFSSARARAARELYSSLCPVIHLRACWSFFRCGRKRTSRTREKGRVTREGQLSFGRPVLVRIARSLSLSRSLGSLGSLRKAV